jgi:glutamyl-tRNA reductase
MPLIVLGTSHLTAPIEIRERLAVSKEQCAKAIEELRDIKEVEEVVVLSTCNRTEVYCLGAQGSASHIQAWLCRTGEFSAAEIEGHLYRHRNAAAVSHLFRVAVGLESLVLGEPQILGQIKDAYNMARDAGGVGKFTDRLFQHALQTAKSVRSNTGINEHPVSVAYTTTVLARQIFGSLRKQKVMLIGAGEMIELCGRHLVGQGIANLMIANRSRDRAEVLAKEFNARALSLDELETWLPEADIVISSTASPTPVIGHAQIKAALKKRRHRPMFLVDIAVPRDIAPDVANLKDVYLYTIDDLQQVVDKNLSHRHEAAKVAQGEVETEVDVFMRWLHGTRASASIERLRHDAAIDAQSLTRKALGKLNSGQDAEAVLSQMAHTLTNRLLHLPTIRLRKAAENEDYDILKAADWLFEPENDRETDE